MDISGNIVNLSAICAGGMGMLKSVVTILALVALAGLTPSGPAAWAHGISGHPSLHGLGSRLRHHPCHICAPKAADTGAAMAGGAVDGQRDVSPVPR
jgi:hypothetical protein